jgi:dihydrofolate reductase
VSSRWSPTDATASSRCSRLISLPKYVVSSSPAEPEWRNSTIINGDVPSEVAKLKAGLDGEIVGSASGQLVQTLMKNDLVDEVRLAVYPVVLGSGDRLLSGTGDSKSMRLINSHTVGDGLAQQTYAFDRAA